MIDKVDLDVKLHPTATRVVTRLSIRPNPQGRSGAPLILDGDGLVGEKDRARRPSTQFRTQSWNGFLTPDQFTLSSAAATSFRP